MSALTVLRRYAAKTDLSTIPDSVLFTHTDTSLTLFDLFPKSNTFHFLMMPRITPSLPEEHTRDLRTLLKWDKEKARKVIEGLARDARSVQDMIKEEMKKRFGFEWPIFTGFHAVPSMEHLHLHIIASDLFSDRMKHKKHYNSFHPKRGFFLHLEDVLSWFDATPSYYKTMAKLPKSQYEPLLKEDLICWRCNESFKTIPKLKEHLRAEWEKDAAKVKVKELKRQREDEEYVDIDKRSVKRSTPAAPEEPTP
ncbi:hypothetical protein M422DRAFT_169064 [Sphaerobolus stellatus SS14]|uniref:Aprataxin C2HE/C2H2/C2HC zinc finger domain-containing protein n=1 Tax=Sphaerobolus stellatus (strain SS14) TaxID=990650 RepID=A0A0C9VYK9_SPHS4|nr:hypothetical protein M422DRAFT_169064 [Sphaerobolus stellatus SS14]